MLLSHARAAAAAGGGTRCCGGNGLPMVGSDFFCLLHRSLDTGTNIYLFMLLNFDDRAKAWLATLALAHVRAVQPALLDPLPARPCENPPLARLFHLQEPHVRLTFQVWTQLRERVRWSFNFSSTA